MKHLIQVILLIGTFAMSAADSQACSCISFEVPEALSEARAVFVGRVIAITKPRSNDPKAALADRLYAVKFRVEKSWKGATFFREVIILSDQGRAGCFSWGPFLKGRKYLVYAEEVEGDSLAVLFSCNRTAWVANASQDIRQLQAFQLFPPRVPSQLPFRDFTKSILIVTKNRL